MSLVKTKYWERTEDGRVKCTLCPRECTMREGQRGTCVVRGVENGEVVLTSYGYASGFCIDPIEKKPLNHFYPGTPVLSFGQVGCNLTCSFCQNANISKVKSSMLNLHSTCTLKSERDKLLESKGNLTCNKGQNYSISKANEKALDGILKQAMSQQAVKGQVFQKLQDRAHPKAIAEACLKTKCKSVAFTYNDPVIFLEYAVDVAKACRDVGIKTVAVTAGYIASDACEEFFKHMDAANVDLKAFTQDFYHRLCSADLESVKETLVYLKHETNVWFEITDLLIPGENDSADEIDEMTRWVVEALGRDVPMHFSAFHPDWKMTDKPRTPAQTLIRARDIAIRNGVRYAYTGNVHHEAGDTTRCANCDEVLIKRDWYELSQYNLTDDGKCVACGVACSGRFDGPAGDWGRKRVPLRFS